MPSTALVDHWPTVIMTVAIILLAFLLPVGILITRDHVKARRQEIIGALEAFFHRDGLPAGPKRLGDVAGPARAEWPILPSFEFVKTKYLMPISGGPQRPDVGIAWYSVPVLAFVTVCCCGMMVALVTTVGDPSVGTKGFLIGSMPHSPFLVGGVTLTDQTLNNYLSAESAVIGFAFLGAYVTSIRTLLRSVANFDLSPLTFFRATVNIITAELIAITLWRAVPNSVFEGLDHLSGTAQSEPFTGLSAPWILVAFILGFVPGLAERYLLTFWRRGMIKRMDARATDRTKIIPLELVDGIDADIRARLEDFNLFDVQNLATANPIMLFVETPFGIYQSIDWVAQAQLATAVGVQRFLTMRELGIRTIFDLEEAMTGCVHAVDTELQCRIAAILLEDQMDSASQIRRMAAAERKPFIDAGRTLSLLIIDDLAVMRLRQIWLTIRSRFHDSMSLRNRYCNRPDGERQACRGCPDTPCVLRPADAATSKTSQSV
jgi:hypothetical protein